jgi:hypothetical protein
MLRSTPFYYLLFLSVSAAAQQTISPTAQQPQSPATQQRLYGRIKRQLTTEVLPNVNVFNKTSSKINRSDAGGNYRIDARPGDTLIFSSAGYLPDTNYIAAWMLEEPDGFNIWLRPNIVSLPSALVDQLSNYEKDSLLRRDDYVWIYMQHQDAIISDSNMTQGFGLSFDLNFFSQHQKEKRRLHRRLTVEEKDYYIDFRCPPAFVERITGLHDDSLRFFMLHYRPTYEYCRKASTEDIFLYINDQVKKYRHPHPTAPQRGRKKSSTAPPPSESAPGAALAYSPPPDFAATPRKAHTDLSSTAGSAAPSP